MRYQAELAVEAGDVVAAHSWLIAVVVALSVVPVCLTVIILVAMVERARRVEAIQALAPVLFRATLSRNRWRDPGQDASPGSAGGQAAPIRGPDEPGGHEEAAMCLLDRAADCGR